MAARHDLGERTEWLDHRYKELEIPPARDGSFRLQPNALHTRPPARYICIALPNDERTLPATLLMALHAEPRPEERRLGKASLTSCQYRWPPYHTNNTTPHHPTPTPPP